MKKIEDCQEGDMLEAPDGSKARVLARLGPLIFRSDWYRYDYAHYRPVTVYEAKEAGWKVLMPDGRLPMKKKELEDLMNVKIVG